MYKHKHTQTNTHKWEEGRTPVIMEAVRSTHRQERGQGTNQRKGRRRKEHGEETWFSKAEDAEHLKGEKVQKDISLHRGEGLNE